MRWIPCILIGLAVASVALAQETIPAPSPTTLPADPRAAQISAAGTDAVAALLQQIESVNLIDQITIGQVLDKTATQSRMLRALEQAKQVGGPRWLDANTAQVRLEIPGRIVADTLAAIVREQADQSPVKYQQIEPNLTALAKRQFTASGTSAAACAIDDVRPAATDKSWAGVDPQARRDAIAAARRQASEQVIDSARNVTLPDGKTVGQIIDSPDSPARDDMRQFLLERPVTAVQFREDKQVEVTLSAPPVETFSTLRQSIEKTPGAPALDDAQWSRVREDFLRAVAPATGLGQLPQTTAALPLPVSINLPQQPPLWARDMIDAAGQAEGSDTRLKTRRAAEQEALANLRRQVLDLPLTPELKIGEAAQNDPEIAAAVDRALAGARAYKSDYYPDGRVIVRSSLELRDVWRQLQER